MLHSLRKTLIILPVFFSCFSIVSCGQKPSAPIEEPVYCIDRTTNHNYQHHQKEEFDEQEGHDEYYQCDRCFKYFDKNKKHIDNIPLLDPLRKIILPVKKNGERIDTLSSLTQAYLALENEDDIARFLYNNEKSRAEKTKGVVFSWRNNHSSGNYHLQIAIDEHFENIVYEAQTYQTIITVNNLIPNKYFYRIADNNNNYSLTDSFVLSGIRDIVSNGVENIRDIGGLLCGDNQRLKYGLLYRSALPSTNDADLFYELGIKTELDLRIKNGSSIDEIGDFKGVSSSIKYVMGLNEREQCWPQYDFIFQNSYESIIKGYFQKVFNLLQDESNYPIDFHCKSGADRTGTLAYIIEGLAGVSYDNIVKDFELTSFYRAPRWRSNIVASGSDIHFDDSGVMGGEYLKDNIRFGKMHKDMMSLYGEDNASLSSAIYKFLTSYCKVDSTMIEKTLSIIKENIMS